MMSRGGHHQTSRRRGGTAAPHRRLSALLHRSALLVAVAGLVVVPPLPQHHHSNPLATSRRSTANAVGGNGVFGGFRCSPPTSEASLTRRRAATLPRSVSTSEDATSATTQSGSLSLDERDDASPLELSAAERARTTVEQGVPFGLALSTVCRADGAAPQGAPWTSYADYVIDASGRPVLLLRDGAEHTRNAMQHTEASVLAQARRVDGRGGLSETAADRSRVTLVGDLARVTERDEVAALTTQFSVRHSYSDELLSGSDGESTTRSFGLWRLEPRSVFFVGGFGAQARWVEPLEYAAAKPDVVASGAASLVAELNSDRHERDRAVAAKHLLDVDDATAVAIVHVDSLGVDFRVSRPRGLVEEYRVAYRIAPRAKPLSVEDAKSELTKLLQEAWEADQGLNWDGWYDTKPTAFKYSTSATSST